MLERNGELQSEKRVLATTSLSMETLADILNGWEFGYVCIASVVPRLRSLFDAFFSCPCHFLSAHSPHGLSFKDYPDRCNLGADRIANVMALRSQSHFPIIAVDLGTAVTYDILVRDEAGVPSFIGGVIAPGLGSLRNSLSFRTALLPRVSGGVLEHAIGKNTQEALLAGTTLGFIGMVRETLNALSAELGTKAYVVATGGDAEMMTSALDLIDEVDADLTFKGLLALSKSLN